MIAKTGPTRARFGKKHEMLITPLFLGIERGEKNSMLESHTLALESTKKRFKVNGHFNHS